MVLIGKGRDSLRTVIKLRRSVIQNSAYSSVPVGSSMYSTITCRESRGYSKNPHTRTPIFGVQADWVLKYRVF